MCWLKNYFFLWNLPVCQDSCFAPSPQLDDQNETSKEVAGDRDRPLGLLLERKMMKCWRWGSLPVITVLCSPAGGCQIYGRTSGRAKLCRSATFLARNREVNSQLSWAMVSWLPQSVQTNAGVQDWCFPWRCCWRNKNDAVGRVTVRRLKMPPLVYL